MQVVQVRTAPGYRSKMSTTMSTLRDTIVPFQSSYGEDNSNSEMTPTFIYVIPQRDSNFHKKMTSSGFSANNLDSKKKKAERPHSQQPGQQEEESRKITFSSGTGISS